MPALAPLVLRPYQKADLKRCITEPTRAGLNGSITGVGKTLVAVELMRHALAQPLAPPAYTGRAKRPPRPPAASGVVLIIGPLNTWDGWRDTVRRQTGEKVRRLGAPSTTPAELLPEVNRVNLQRGRSGWYFTGWDFFLRMSILDLRHVDHVVYDEIHRASNRKALAAKRIWLLSTLVANKGGYIHAASATPFGNKKENGFAVGKGLWPRNKDEFGNYARWVSRHLEKITRQLQTPAGIQVVEEIGRELRPGSIVRSFPCYFRHEAHEKCCKFHPRGAKADLPPRVIHRVPVPLTPAQRVLYDQLEAIMMAWIKDHEWPIDSEGWPMVNFIRMVQVCLAAPTTELRQLLKKNAPPEEIIKVTYPLNAPSAKIDVMLDILRDIPENERVLIFTHSAGIIPVLIHRIKKEFDIDEDDNKTVRPWFGETKTAEREATKADFIYTGKDGSPENSEFSPLCRIIVAQADAIGHGTDGLQRVCWNEIWFSPSASMVTNEQAAGRLNRDGQTHPVNVWEIYAEGTVERDQLDRLDRTAKVMHDVLRVQGKKKKSKSGSKKGTPDSKTPKKKGKK